MAFLDELYSFVDNGKVLVFPTEESARAFSVSYVLSRKKGMLASSVLAFDTFSKLFYPDSASEAAEADKLLFSAYVASVLCDDLKYFASDEYPELRSGLKSAVRAMLESLSEADRLPLRSRDALHDILLISSRYRDFLKASSLSDRSFTEPDVHETDSEYVVVMPSAFPKERRLLKALEPLSSVMALDAPSQEFPPLSVYTTEKEEIRALFLSIRKLLDEDVPFSDIIITVSDPERLLPYLSQEAFLHDIPIRLVTGSSPLESSSGKFFSLLKNIYESSYSLDSLKAFFLDPSMPFSDPVVLRHFIYRAVEDAITSAPDPGNDRYMKIPEELGGKLYGSFRKILDSLMREIRPDRVIPLLRSLSSLLFIPEEFSLSEEDAGVYSFAMNELSLFLESARMVSSAGYNASVPLFPLFIEYLGKRRYVPRQKKEGIRIYPFGQDAALVSEYRFIIALNEEECGRIVRDASFLSDYELSSPRDEKKITSDILRGYMAVTGHLLMSASSETYGGTVLPLMELRRESCHAPSDPWRNECGEYASFIYPLQAKGRRNALVSSLKSSGKDVTYSGKGKKLETPLRLSFSAADSYEHCPYMHALQYRFSLRNLRKYVPDTMDHLEIGSRLHSVMERFYKEGGRDPESRIPVLFDEEMALWMDGKRLSDGVVTEMRKSSTRPSRMLVSYLRSMYLGNLIRVSEMMNDMSSPVPGFGLEEELSRDFPSLGFSIYGIIDRMAELPDGGGVLFDYKKGRRFRSDDLERKSLQFYIYRLLSETGSPVYPEKAYFVTLRDAVLSEVRLDLGDEDVIRRLSEDADGIRNGFWKAVSSDENCRGCQYRGICRRRFSIR